MVTDGPTEQFARRHIKSRASHGRSSSLSQTRMQCRHVLKCAACIMGFMGACCACDAKVLEAFQVKLFDTGTNIVTIIEDVHVHQISTVNEDRDVVDELCVNTNLSLRFVEVDSHAKFIASTDRQKRGAVSSTSCKMTINAALVMWEPSSFCKQTGTATLPKVLLWEPFAHVIVLWL